MNARPRDNLPPVVMIHGAFVGPWAFDEFREPFEAAGYKVHTPALRHHEEGAQASKALGTTGLIDFADDLAAFIRTLNEPPVLLGHSMGGLLAQMLAARGLAKALVLLAPSRPWGVMPSTWFELASAQAMAFIAGDFRDSIIDPDPTIAAMNTLDRLPADARRRVFARFQPESGRATFELMHWALDRSRASAVDPGKVTCPILCLAGEHDRINSPASVRSIAERYRPHARFEMLRGHSHWLLTEPGWERIAKRCLVFLSDAAANVSAAAQ